MSSFPALRKNLNLISRRDELDYDYLDKLSPKELDFLNRFTEEYVHANLKHSGTKLHVTPEDRKICTDRNNSRNRCFKIPLLQYYYSQFKEENLEPVLIDQYEKSLLESIDKNNLFEETVNAVCDTGERSEDSH